MRDFHVVYTVLDDKHKSVLVEEAITADKFIVLEGGHFMFVLGNRAVKVIGFRGFISMEVGEEIDETTIGEPDLFIVPSLTNKPDEETKH